MILFFKSMFRKKVTKIYISLYGAIIFIFLAVLSITLYYLNIENMNYRNKAYIEIISEYDLSDEIKKNNKNDLKLIQGAVLKLNLGNGSCEDITHCELYMLNDKELLFILENREVSDNNIIIPNKDGVRKKIIDFYENLNTSVSIVNPFNNKAYEFNIQKYEENEFYFYYISSELYHEITRNNYMHYYFIYNMTEKQSYEYHKLFKDIFEEKTEYIDLKISSISPMPILSRLAFVLIILGFVYMIISIIINMNMIDDINKNIKMYYLLGFKKRKIFCYSFLIGLLMIGVSYVFSVLTLGIFLILINIIFNINATLPLLIYHGIIYLYFSLILVSCLVIKQKRDVLKNK